jgi:hypothetical protein
MRRAAAAERSVKQEPVRAEEAEEKPDELMPRERWQAEEPIRVAAKQDASE